VLGSGTDEPTVAEKVTSGDAKSSTKVPPFVTTGERKRLHCKISPMPVIGPIEVNKAQEENAGSDGPSIKSSPAIEERENPTVDTVLLTKNLVPVVKVKVPSEPIVTEAEPLSREKPPENGKMLDVSATAEIVIRSLVKDVEPIVPLAMVMSANVMGPAFAVTTPRTHASADASTTAEVFMYVSPPEPRGS
jgi:hypothetical protein